MNNNLLIGTKVENKSYHNLPPLDESLYDLHNKINNNEINNVIQMIKYWADKQPNKMAYNWIEKSDGKVTKSYTYGELWKEIESIKYHIENEWKVKKGDCVFIVYPPGLEFIFAFFGCMLAGCVAVPVYPPIPGRTLKKGVDKLKLLQESCRAKIALTSKSYNIARRTSKVISFKAKWPNDLKWYITDNIEWKPKYTVNMNEINIDENAVAFLQYTSGSTGDPKGVMILHKNYFHNVNEMYRLVIPKCTENINLCWLPQYHDMGLIGCYTTLVCSGGTQYCMSPVTFIQNPTLWIHCLSRYQCNTTTAPNFAFELAVRKWHEPKDGHQIDLSHVYYMGNGAEPVRIDTLTKFYNLFEHYGLPRGVIHPQYGLAETCVFTCIEHHVLTHTDQQGIRRVCCGNIDIVAEQFGVDIRIINSETGEEVKDDEEGEIIISSQSIAAGYMNRPQLSKETFQFQLPNNNNNSNNSEDKYYLKTGDLGMIVKPDREWSIAHPDRHPIYGQNDKLLEEELNQRHLVITGRIKDLIILNGRNYYPQDIELCVENALTNKRLVRSGCVVATSIEWNNEESFAVVCELRKDVLAQHIKDEKKKDKKLSKELILKHVCIEMVEEIHDEFGVKPCIVALIKEKTIPKTTSGKVRRKATAAALLSTNKNAKLKLIHQYEVEFLHDANSSKEGKTIIEDYEQKEEKVPHLNVTLSTVDDIKAQVYNILNEVLYLDDLKIGNEIDINDNTPFSDMGLASMDVINVSDIMQERFNMEFDATQLYSYPTIQRLSEYIVAVKSGMTFIPLPHLSTKSIKAPRIAIVGVSCRLPAGISSPMEFWLALSHDLDLINLSNERSSEFVGEGGFLNKDHIELFDNEFFGISKMEAQHMDPQQRLLLTVAWESCYVAGYESKDVLKETRTGVYIGKSATEYQVDTDAPTSLMATSVHNAIAANRISYAFGLNGPSLVIDTACSSSLVALVQACSDLNHNKCDAAFVGGINLMHNPKSTQILSESGFLSPRYRCRTFDQSADGYVRSEGCVMLYIKRVEDAQLEDLPILSIINGGSVASDGRTMSLTAPNARMQAQVIQDSLHDAHVNSDQIDFIELHGTGTALGDPIEMSGIQMALSPSTSPIRKQTPLVLSSAKSTLGHLEAAAGVTGVLKALLQLLYKQIPRNIHLKGFNDKLNMKGCIMPHVANCPRSNEETKYGYTLRNKSKQSEKIYCGVSSFGFGGTLAHVIMSSSHITNLPECLKLDDSNKNSPLRPVFVFSGQGGLNWFDNSVIKDLYKYNEIYNKAIHKCCELMNDELKPYTLLQLLSIQEKNDEQKQLRVENDKQILLEYAQPCIFAIQYGLVEVWKSMNIVPSVVVGHSLGEICAAYTAGIMSIEKACEFVLFRNKIMNEHAEPNGGMMVVMSDLAEVLRDIASECVDQSDVVVSGYNGPRQLVLSGSKSSLSDLKASIERHPSSSHLRLKELDTRLAFHSPLMQKSSVQMKEKSPLRHHTDNNLLQKVSFVSTVTGKLESYNLLSSEYWANQIVKPVLFQNAIETIVNNLKYNNFLEIGPGRVMNSMVRHATEKTLNINSSIDMLQSSNYDMEFDGKIKLKLFSQTSSLFDWKRSRIFPLPELNQFKEAKTSVTIEKEQHLLFGEKIGETSDLILWRQHLQSLHYDYLDDYVVDGNVNVPGALYVSTSIACALSINNAADVSILKNLQFEAMLPLMNRSADLKMFVTYDKLKNTLNISSDLTSNQLHFTSNVINQFDDTTAQNMNDIEHLMAMHKQCDRAIPKNYYDVLYSKGYEFGDSFRLIESGFSTSNYSFCKIKSSKFLSNEILHPTVLDCCFQTALLMALNTIDDSTMNTITPLPYNIEQIVYDSLQFKEKEYVYSFVERIYSSERESCFKMWFAHKIEETNSWRVFGYVENFVARALKQSSTIPKFWYKLIVDDCKFDMQNESKENHCIEYLTSDSVLAGTCNNYRFWDTASNEHELSENNVDVLVFILDVSPTCIDNLLSFIQWLVPQHTKSVANLLICTQSYSLNENHLLSQAPAIGFIRSLQNELRDSFQQIKLIDVPSNIEQLNAEFVTKIFELPDTELCINSSDFASASLLKITPFSVDDVKQDGHKSSHILSKSVTDKICVIVGGTKGIGLRIGAWLITQGINTICLLSRSGHINDNDKWIINEMKAYNEHVNIIIKSCDVLNEVECQSIFNELKLIGSIGGIVYGAAAWSDGLIMNMTNESLHKAMDPKVIGTYNIHRITIDDVEIKESLKFFVVLSSIASVVGAPGLGNYNAGNTYQELLMQYRVNVLNVCGGVLNLGSIIDTGHMIDDKSLSYNPKYMLVSSDVINALEYILWNQYITNKNDDVKKLKFQQLIVHKFNPFNVIALQSMCNKFKNIVIDTSNMHNVDLDCASTIEVLKEIISAYVISSNAELDIHKHLSELGVDSLAMNSILNDINSRFGIQLQITSIFQHNTIHALANYLSSEKDTVELHMEAQLDNKVPSTKMAATTTKSKDEEKYDKNNSSKNYNAKLYFTERCSGWQRHIFQLFWWLFVMMMFGIFYLPVSCIMRESIEEYGANSFFKIGCTLLLSFIIYGIELIIFTLACKWLILGRSKVGYYRLWSLYFIRWWCTSSLVNMTNRFVGFFLQETSLYCIWLRLLGANIGKYVIIDTTRLRDVDLLTIGDESVIEKESRISGHQFVHLNVNGITDIYLRLEKVNIGSQCLLDYKSVVEAGDIVPDNHKVFDINTFNKIQALSKESLEEVSIGRRLAIFCFYGTVSQFVGILIYLATWCLCISIALWPANYIYDIDEVLGITFLLSCMPILMTFGFSCCTIIIKWLLIGKFNDNSSYLYTSWFMFRFWLVNRYITTFSQIQMLWNSMSVLSVYSYKLLGLNIGMGTMIVLPNVSCAANLIELGNDVWLGHSNLFIPWTYSGSKILFNVIVVGDECVFGESCVILGNVQVENRVVVGPNSVVSPNTNIKENMVVMGSSELMKRPTNQAHTLEYSALFNVYFKFQCLLLLLTLLTYVILFGCSYPVACFWKQAILDITVINDWTFIITDPKHWKLIPMQQWGVIFLTLLIAVEMFIYTLVISIIIRIIKDRWNNENVERFYNNRVLLWLWEAHLKSLSLVSPINADSMLINGSELMSMLLKLFGANIGKSTFVNCRFLFELDLLDIGSNCIIDEAMILPHTVSGFKTAVLDQHLIKSGNNCIFEVDSRPLPAVKMDNNCVVKYSSVIMKGVEIRTHTKDHEWLLMVIHQLQNCRQFHYMLMNTLLKWMNYEITYSFIILLLKIANHSEV